MFSLSRIDKLWITRMNYPFNLYKILALMRTFHFAREYEKEKQLADEFLDLIKSHEKSINLCSKGKDEEPNTEEESYSDVSE